MNMLITLRYRRVIDTLLSFMREINRTCLKLSGLKISALVYAKHSSALMLLRYGA